MENTRRWAIWRFIDFTALNTELDVRSSRRAQWVQREARKHSRCAEVLQKANDPFYGHLYHFMRPVRQLGMKNRPVSICVEKKRNSCVEYQCCD